MIKVHFFTIALYKTYLLQNTVLKVTGAVVLNIMKVPSTSINVLFATFIGMIKQFNEDLKLIKLIKL